VAKEAGLKARSTLYELKFGLIGFAVGISGIAGATLAHNMHHHVRHDATNSASPAANDWPSERRR
jgi:hypothetical protein